MSGLDKTESEAFRELAASAMAMDIIVRMLLNRYINSLPAEEAPAEIARLRASIRATESLKGSSSDEFFLEMQSDVAVLAQVKLDAMLRLALGPAAVPSD